MKQGPSKQGQTARELMDEWYAVLQRRAQTVAEIEILRLKLSTQDSQIVMLRESLERLSQEAQ